MVVSVKQMHAGDGYNYLLKSTADAELGHDVASYMTAYYTEAGTPPGTWLGNGLAGLAGGAGIEQGSQINASQMEAMFKHGRDPVTGDQIGAAFKKVRTASERIAERVAKLPADMAPAIRAEAVAKIEAAERAHTVGKPVSGFDFTFSPVKSVSVLWALGDHGIREQVYEAHRAAVADVIATMEIKAARTRVGTDGVAQVETNGLIAAAFDHWDSRSGDPQLHTHVVIANRTQGPDGKWRTLDSRGALFPSTVAMSELYDARIADHLTKRLGVEWAERSDARGKARRFEIRGIPDSLTTAFSSRSADIEDVTGTLISAYRHAHGRDPSARMVHKLRQQATLQTRPDKKLTSLAELTERWRATARSVLKREPRTTMSDATTRTLPEQLVRFDDLATSNALDRAVDAAWEELSTNRSTWTMWNARAAAIRASAHLRMENLTERELLIDHITGQIEARSIRLTPELVDHTPAAFLRADGTSAFRKTGAEVFTSAEILSAENRLITAGRSHDGPAVSIDTAEHYAAAPTPEGFHLSDDQAAAVVQIAASGRTLDVLVGPAGAGKTTALGTLMRAWYEEHGTGSVRGLAPSAAAADVLADSLGIATENTAKWLHAQKDQPEREAAIKQLAEQLEQVTDPDQHRAISQQLAAVQREYDQWALKPGELLIIDESSLAGTLALDRLREQAETAGAKILLVGDWAQLSAVDAGGAFGLLVRDREGTAPELTGVRRFKNEWEKHASIRLRVGDKTVIGDYESAGRLTEGTPEDMMDAAYTAWRRDREAGKTSLMIAADNETVTALNARAREDLITAGTVTSTGVDLHDGTKAGSGDQIVTRVNDRRLTVSENSWVKNGDTWTVEKAHRDGSLLVRRASGGKAITLPADYVAASVELGYATTAHRAQGRTVDTAHAIVTGQMSREVLYVAMTRAKETNAAYIALDHDPDHQHHDEPQTGRDVFADVLDRVGAPASATETGQNQAKDLDRLDRIIAEYETIASEGQRRKWSTVITGSGLTEDQIDQVLASPAYTGLVSELRRAEHMGIEPDKLLPQVIPTQTGLASADDLTKVLHHRVAKVLDSPRLKAQAKKAERALHEGLIPIIRTGDSDLDTGLAEREAHISAVIDQHVDELRANPEPWVKQLGVRPTHPEQARQWDAALRTVVAYRLTYNITDANVSAPDADTARWSQRSHLNRARQAIETARTAQTRSQQHAQATGPVHGGPSL